ncbi:hypothetical protein NSA02_03425 [Ligilactobacillus murinus]|jgi:hypothetical protein|uniref:hypothetical protein n=1 Tax=Ligilactobacillus murinus TaxID=1622 RepID=UPI00214B29B6|nr:hypothetical protein [Ligilactobacillus murinus]MCR1895861.1 hypothetical protein [Ligilactobacillus murinus]
MKKYVHFWTDDPYSLLNLLAQIYCEKNIDSNEAYAKSTAYAFGDMLYHEEYQLNQEEWVAICKKYQKVHNQSGDFLIGENDDQGQYFCEQIQQMERFKKRKLYYDLRGYSEFEYFVYDVSQEKIYPCNLGEHFKTILKIIDELYLERVEKMTEEQLDNFVLTNFKLYGNTYSIMSYAKDVSSVYKL